MSTKQLDIQALREPGEARLLKRTFTVIAIGYLIFCGITLSLFLMWIALAFLTVAVLRSRYLAETIEVGDDQFPRLWEIVRRCSVRLDVPAPRVFLSDNPGKHPIYTVPVPEPAILLHANFLHMLEDAELEFFIYHELAHGKLGHRRFLDPINVLENVGAVSWVLTTPLEVVRYLLRPWQRLADFSADRVALACIDGRLDVAASALARVTAGEEIFREVEPRAFLAQARRLDDSRLLAVYEIVTGELGTARRLSKLARFAESPAFGRLIEWTEPRIRRGLLASSADLVAAAVRTLAGRPARSAALLPVLLLGALAADVQAERLILKNGLEVRGYLVGSEDGSYLVRIGSFTKRVAEADVQSIVDDASEAPAPAGPPAMSSPALGSVGPLSALLQGGQLSKLLGGVGGGAPGADASGLLQALGGGQGGAPGAGAGLQSLLGGLGGAGGGASMLALTEKMRDPAFQQTFLNQLQDMDATGPSPGAARPYIDLLKQLFEQLNSAPPPAK